MATATKEKSQTKSRTKEAKRSTAAGEVAQELKPASDELSAIRTELEDVESRMDDVLKELREHPVDMAEVRQIHTEVKSLADTMLDALTTPEATYERTERTFMGRLMRPVAIVAGLRPQTKREGQVALASGTVGAMLAANTPLGGFLNVR